MSDAPDPTILEEAPQNDEISTTVARCEYLLKKWCPIFMTRGKYLREESKRKKPKISEAQRLMAEVMDKRGLSIEEISRHTHLTKFQLATILYVRKPIQ